MSQSSREQQVSAASSSPSGSIARVLVQLPPEDAAVVQRELHTLSLEIEQLQRALVSRVRLEQAKGVLLASGADSLEDAFRLMRDFARSHNLLLHEVAASVVRGQLRLAASGRLSEEALSASRA